MITAKELWENPDLRCGGFYELGVEVSSNRRSLDRIENLLKSIFDAEFMHGPLNCDFEQTEIAIDPSGCYEEVLGYVDIEGNQLPFKIVFISEEGEPGSNWLDICFYTAMYEQVLGQQYQTWASNGRSHRGLDDLLIKVLTHMNATDQIRIGVIGFEVSGFYYLETLKEYKLKKNDVSHTKFFVNTDAVLKPENWAQMQIIKPVSGQPDATNLPTKQTL